MLRAWDSVQFGKLLGWAYFPNTTPAWGSVRSKCGLHIVNSSWQRRTPIPEWSICPCWSILRHWIPPRLCETCISRPNSYRPIVFANRRSPCFSSPCSIWSPRMRTGSPQARVFQTVRVFRPALLCLYIGPCEKFRHDIKTDACAMYRVPRNRR